MNEGVLEMFQVLRPSIITTTVKVLNFCLKIGMID